MRDRWMTPRGLYDWANRRYGFAYDLACTADNALAGMMAPDSLSVPWAISPDAPVRWGFCNPPYSDIDPWVEKAWEESQRGFGTVLLIPTPNGEARWGKWVFGKASKIIFINGRVAFLRPDGTPVPGNTRGSCFVIYEPYTTGNTAIDWMDRDGA